MLPPQVVDRLDLNTMRAVPGTFVDRALRRRHTDALFTAAWAGTGDNAVEAYLYILIEHQSRPDPLMALRLLTYQLRIWERHQRLNPEQARLPVIIPVVLYQGAARWTAPSNLAGLFDADAATLADLGGLLPSFEYLLDDVSRIGRDELLARPLTSAAALTLVVFGLDHSAPDLTPELVTWLDTFRDMWRQPDGHNVLSVMLTYLWTTSTTPEQTLLTFISGLGPEAQEVAMTTAEKLRAEGEARGRAEGEARGRAEGEVQGMAALLAEQLAVRFGELNDEQRRTIAAGSREQLVAWSAQLIRGADTIVDVFR